MWGNLDLNQRPTGYESAFFPPWSSLTICSQHYDTRAYVLWSNEEICCLLAQIGLHCAASVPRIFKDGHLKIS